MSTSILSIQEYFYQDICIDIDVLTYARCVLLWAQIFKCERSQKTKTKGIWEEASTCRMDYESLNGELTIPNLTPLSIRNPQKPFHFFHFYSCNWLLSSSLSLIRSSPSITSTCLFLGSLCALCGTNERTESISLAWGYPVFTVVFYLELCLRNWILCPNEKHLCPKYNEIIKIKIVSEILRTIYLNHERFFCFHILLHNLIKMY